MKLKQSVICFSILFLGSSTLFAGPREDVIKELNQSSSVASSDGASSWKQFFEACIEITPPPMEVSDVFNMSTVWPGMSTWEEVSAWSEQNEHIEVAFAEAAKRAIIGLPYGSEHVPAHFRDAGVYAEIGVDDRLHAFDFAYVEMVKLACLCATAEMYRLFEIGENDRAIQLMISEFIVLRKFCDREFLKEQLTFMPMLGYALENARDMFYRYKDKLSAIQFRAIAMDGIPNLETDATSLLMPEGDRIVGKALLLELFSVNGVADPAKFREVLTDIQADKEPLARAGAARYWESIALVHRGRDDSVNRLNKIYDDWWRRWKMRLFHPQLKMDSELEKSNPVKYAAVSIVVRNIEELFAQRDLLTVEINGTAVSAALCGYFNHYGKYPSHLKKMYAQLLHRKSNVDALHSLPLRTDSDWELYAFPAGPFHYRALDKNIKIETIRGNVSVDKGQCLLYSVAIDDEDNRGLNAGQDFILWPPLKSLERNAGLLE